MSQYDNDISRFSELLESIAGIPKEKVVSFYDDVSYGGRINEFTNVIGTTPEQKQKLDQLFEAQRLYETIKTAQNREYRFNSTEAAQAYFKQFYEGMNDKEHVVATYLDSNLKVISTTILNSGTINGANVPVREMVKEALFLNAVQVIMSHNHPGGRAEVLREDVATTKRVGLALASVGVDLVDHIIVAGNDAVSLADRGLVSTASFNATLHEFYKVAESSKDYVTNQQMVEVEEVRSGVNYNKELLAVREQYGEDSFQYEQLKSEMSLSLDQYASVLSRLESELRNRGIVIAQTYNVGGVKGVYEPQDCLNDYIDNVDIRPSVDDIGKIADYITENYMTEHEVKEYDVEAHITSPPPENEIYSSIVDAVAKIKIGGQITIDGIGLAEAFDSVAVDYPHLRGTPFNPTVDIVRDEHGFITPESAELQRVVHSILKEGYHTSVENGESIINADCDKPIDFDIETSITRVRDGGNLKAFASIQIGNALCIDNVKVYEKETGERHVAMPSIPNGEGIFREVIYPSTPKVREQIEKSIWQHYDDQMKELGKYMPKQQEIAVQNKSKSSQER